MDNLLNYLLDNNTVTIKEIITRLEEEYKRLEQEGLECWKDEKVMQEYFDLIASAGDLSNNRYYITMQKVSRANTMIELMKKEVML